MASTRSRHPDPLLTEKEAAAYIVVSVRTLQKWRYIRTGPVYLRINGFTIRYRQSSLDAYLSDSEHAAASSAGAA